MGGSVLERRVRRLRRRRVVGVVLLVVGAACAGLWVASRFCCFSYGIITSNRTELCISCNGSGIGFSMMSPARLSTVGWCFVRERSDSLDSIEGEAPPFTKTYSGTVADPGMPPGSPPSRFWAIYIHLWIPTSVFTLMGGLLVWAGRGRVKPGCCAACDYPMTGLTGMVCPECGAGRMANGELLIANGE